MLMIRCVAFSLMMCFPACICLFGGLLVMFRRIYQDLAFKISESLRPTQSLFAFYLSPVTVSAPLKIPCDLLFLDRPLRVMPELFLLQQTDLQPLVDNCGLHFSSLS